MKVSEFIKRLQQEPQDCKIEFLFGSQEALFATGGGYVKATLGSIYDDTDPLFNRIENLKQKATLVTIEFDEESL